MEENNTLKYPRRILMTADTVGGVWTYSLNLAKALGKFDIQVYLATMGSLPTEKQKVQAAQIPNLTLHSSDYALEWMDKPWEGVDKAGPWLMELQKQIQPDLIHLNNYCHGHLDWNAPVMMVCHSCVFSWWENVIGSTPPDQYQEYFTRVQRGLQAADLVVAPSRDMLQSICRIYGEVANKIVIPNGGEPVSIARDEKQDIIFSMGRLWDSAKNIESLNRVAGELSWPVVIAGDDAVPGSSDNATFANVTYTGKLDQNEVNSWLSKASIYALPARYEPFGLSILEAAHAGCTLVLGDIPSLRENWIGAAFFVEPGNLEALKYTLETLSQRPDLRKKYAERAAIRAKAFTTKRMANLYLAKYEEMLNSPAISDQKNAGKAIV
ncbi:glycosyltransferase family 4 protein [Telluribacter sp. SYSU D00476]|uniref:glycosyltransferase family 4 protein n=1 Tax=Telluribacter sp. SYSU D00476 TaxID=2811430 RepID=UPI001FF3BD2B|nr:glycosyltransferase family 4 protein [Telluribacter sp. SYSU D00476]